MRIEWRPSGNLRVIPEASSITRRREVEIDLNSLVSVYYLKWILYLGFFHLLYF